MPRRNYHQARKGQVYCVDWPEWHVECAHEDCDETCLIANLGEVWTAREAEMKMRNLDVEDNGEGWTKNGGLWFCPKHKPKRRANAAITKATSPKE